MLADRIGAHAELAFSRSIAGGELVVDPVLDAEWEPIASHAEQYLNLPLGIVDASVVALAERHHVTRQHSRSCHECCSCPGPGRHAGELEPLADTALHSASTAPNPAKRPTSRNALSAIRLVSF